MSRRPHRLTRFVTTALLAITPALAAQAEVETLSDDACLGVKIIEGLAPRPAPEWALRERHLIETLNRAGKLFVEKYTNADGSLIWRDRYEGGMNSSDDAYEAFRGFSLFHALAGSKELDRLHRHVWEGITRQFTRYGNIYREFDSNWDWMHHGEGLVSFYPFGLTDPYNSKFRERSIRFAAMYTGEDPESPNYDPELKLIRSPMTGSRGPKFEWTKRDWIPTNANLVYFHLPYDDIPGVISSTGWINDHPDDDQFARIVKTMSERMGRGDVPVNLYATGLIANAFLYTGDETYRRWITDYVGAWVERTERNGGITPDNIGLTGEIGEYNNGNWWGGYYGWQWVDGTRIVRAEIVAAKVAVLLTGDMSWLKLPRSQMAMMRKRGRERDGEFVVPVRYSGSRKWHHFQAEDSYPYFNLWYVSQSREDWDQLRRVAEGRVDGVRRTRSDPDLGWPLYLKGANPGFPARALASDLETVNRLVRRIQNEHGDPETRFDGYWNKLNPIPTDNLVRLTVGGAPVPKKGELLFSRLRYFDVEAKTPGLPQGVAALVTGTTADSTTVELINTNLFEPRRILIQAGAYGEHMFTSTRYQADSGEPARTNQLNERYLRVDLAAGAGIVLELGMERFAHEPAYDFPWVGSRSNQSICVQ